MDDPRGDHVSTILDIWKEHEVKEVIISNHVASETIHNIFKNHIRETLSLTHKTLRQRYQLTDDDMQIIGDYQTAQRLYNLIPENIMKNFITSGELYYDITKIIKEFKTDNAIKRDYLHHYYQRSIDTYISMLNDLRMDMGLTIKTPVVEEKNVEPLALSYVRLLQLDAHDAFHLATSHVHGCNFFATLDGDFVNNYYSEENIGNLRILKVG